MELTVGNIFCGESMFSIEKDKSKISSIFSCSLN